MATLVRLLRHIRAHPLAGQAPWAAVWRFLRWQAVSRLTGRPMIVPYVGATRLTLRRGLSSATGSYYVGLTDPAEMGFLLHLLRPDDLFVDVGANIGAYTILAAGVCGASVRAVEPAPAVLPHLAENLALNGIAALVAIDPTALGEAEGPARLSAGLGAANRILPTGRDTGGVSVPMTTLDALLASAVPVLLKLDVEGHEAPILRGAGRTLAAATLRAAIIETNGHGDDAAVHALMTAAGFTAAAYDPATRALSPRQGPGFPNTLYMRDARWLAERLAAGAAYEVLGRRF